MCVIKYGRYSASFQYRVAVYTFAKYSLYPYTYICNKNIIWYELTWNDKRKKDNDVLAKAYKNVCFFKFKNKWILEGITAIKVAAMQTRAIWLLCRFSLKNSKEYIYFIKWTICTVVEIINNQQCVLNYFKTSVFVWAQQLFTLFGVNLS